MCDAQLAAAEAKHDQVVEQLEAAEARRIEAASIDAALRARQAALTQRESELRHQQVLHEVSQFLQQYMPELSRQLSDQNSRFRIKVYRHDKTEQTPRSSLSQSKQRGTPLRRQPAGPGA